jgi:hypothetical protein
MYCIVASFGFGMVAVETNGIGEFGQPREVFCAGSLIAWLSGATAGGGHTSPGS